MAAKRKPEPTARRRCPWGTQPANAASQRGLAAARAALLGDAPSIATDEGLAQREQWYAEDQARRNAQGCLALRTAIE